MAVLQAVGLEWLAVWWPREMPRIAFNLRARSIEHAWQRAAIDGTLQAHEKRFRMCFAAYAPCRWT